MSAVELAERKEQVLAVDGPNIDAVTGNLLGRRPVGIDHPRYPALRCWLETSAPPTVRSSVAAVFLGVPTDPSPSYEGWVASLSQAGLWVFAKPREAGDIDEEMVAYLESRPWGRIVVASNDAQRFVEPLTKLSDRGVITVALGFREQAGRLAATPGIEFVDLEDIPGVFCQPLPRVRLQGLPPEGRWFEPRVRIGTPVGEVA